MIKQVMKQQEDASLNGGREGGRKDQIKDCYLGKEEGSRIGSIGGKTLSQF